MKNNGSKCENCIHFEYDDELDCYVCNINLDEDEAEHYMRKSTRECPFFMFYDEYKSVRKQN